MAGSIDTTYFLSDLNGMIKDLHLSVIGLGSNAVSASASDLTTATNLDIGGEILRITQSLVAPASSISATTIGMLCSVSDTERMVAGFSKSTDGVLFPMKIVDITT